MSTTTLNPKAFFQRTWKSRFARNVALVASGTAGAQAITMAFSPIITRIYGPEAFGLLGTFMAIVAVATPLAALAYPIAIVLPRDDRDALGLVRLSLAISFAIALLAGALLLAGGDWLIATLNAQSVASFLFLIPLAMLFAAWTQTAHQWLIRKKEFGVIAWVAVAQSLIVNSAKSGVGWLNPVGAVLIVIGTAGSLLHAMMMLIGAKRRYQPTQNDAGGSTAILRDLAHRHRDFPMYRAPQITINAASQSLPVLMLAAFFGPAAAGFYALAKMVMGVPAALLGKAVGDVFYPRVAEAAHNGERLSRLILRATVALGGVGFLPFSIVIAFGPTLFGLVFGSEWITAGEYARWIALWMFFMFLNNPSIMALPVLEAQRFHLFFSVGTILVRAGVLAAGYYLFQSDLIAVALFAASGAALNIALIVIVIYLAMLNDKKRRSEH